MLTKFLTESFLIEVMIYLFNVW